MVMAVDSSAAAVTPSASSSSLSSLALGPLVPVGRRVFASMLGKLQRGCLVVDDRTNGERAVYGDEGCADMRAGITVRDALFYGRLCVRGDLGFAEAFMSEEVDVDDLTALFKIFISNRNELNDLSVKTAFIGNIVSYLGHTRLANTISNALSNISAHYDLGNELFESFLDKTMMYSSAVWSKQEESMTSAQMTKLRMMMDKAKIVASDEVLEIGTGWGTFAIEAVKQRGCRVTTVTLSKEQRDFAAERIRKLPREQADRITLLLTDYRSLPKLYPGKRFDKIVSIEMIEAVGHEFLPTYFEVCDRMLNREHGIMVFQCITMPESRYEAYLRGCDFIQAYIFPGGHCPSVARLTESIESGSKSQLSVEHVENIGPHYARTLRVWREVFLAKFDEKLASYPKFMPEKQGGVLGGWLAGSTSEKPQRFYSEEFKRKWLYYFTYCEAGFATRSIGNVQMVLTRPNNMLFIKGQENVML